MTAGPPVLDGRQDEGFTLVELLVAMSIVMILVAVTLTGVLTASGAVKTTTQQQGLNEEARQAINRMVRDIRQAKSVVTAVNPDGPLSFDPTKLVALRVQADFDGDTCIGGTGGSPGVVCSPYNASNPEDVTYCYEPGSQQLYVIDNQAAAVVPISSSSTSCSGGQPLLAGNVGAFTVEYRSNNYRYDLDPSDGVTTWRELDAAPAPVGNGNGQLDVELPEVDSVVLDVTMSIGGKSQLYRTQVDLRNRS